MNETEITKALRCCADRGCKFCPEQGKTYCKETVASLAWDLIYRQKAEVERLNKLVIEKHTENNRLHKYLHCTKADAYREFAERLKKKGLRNNPHGGSVDNRDINDTLTELTERKEDEGK